MTFLARLPARGVPSGFPCTVDLGLGISASPITYAVDGRQYLSLLVGWGGGGTAFAFPGTPTWPYAQ